MTHPLTDADCKQIMIDVSDSWDYDKDPSLIVYELMRTAYDKGASDRLEEDTP